jgi:hypothetical protein
LLIGEFVKLDNRIFGIIGLIGGVLAIVGFFGTWYWVKLPPASGFPNSSFSGRDFTQSTTKMPYLVLVGGVITVVGSFTAFFRPRWVTKVLLATGGILILIGGAAGFIYLWPVSMRFGSESLAHYGASYGAYLVVIGGILSILMTLGLKEKKIKR